MWTLGLQTANFLVLVWLMQHFLYRPLCDLIRRRQEAAASLLADAETSRREAEAERTAMATARAAIAGERLATLAAADEEAQRQRRALLARAADEIDRMRSDARSQLAREQAEAVRTLGGQAASLAIDLAGRLARRLAPSEDAGFVAEAVHRIEALDGDELHRIRAAIPADAVPQVVSARPLPPADAAQVAQALGHLLGHPVQPAYRTDPALIAGIELHLPGWSLSNGLAADLAVLGERLRDEDGRTGDDA